MNHYFVNISYNLPSDGNDYIRGQVTLIFLAGSTRACTNITIIDDQIAESLEETFLIEIDSIEPNALDAQLGDILSATVTIVDNDGNYDILDKNT